MRDGEAVERVRKIAVRHIPDHIHPVHQIGEFDGAPARMPEAVLVYKNIDCFVFVSQVILQVRNYFAPFPKRAMIVLPRSPPQYADAFLHT